MCDRRPQPHQGGPGAAGDLLEGGTGPPAWHRTWRALPPAARALAVAVGIVALLVSALVWSRGQAVERELRQRVVVASTIGVWSSSTYPRGGSVHYFLTVRNDGPRPVWVQSLDAPGDVLRLRLRDDGDRGVAAGDELVLPLSVRLTCRADSRWMARPRLDAELRVRTQDGGSTARGVDPGAAVPLLDTVATLCQARPGLTDLELSGPVLRGG